MGFFTDTDFDSIYDMADAMNEVVERTIRSNMECVRPRQLGLDDRAGYELFVNEDCIAVRNGNRRSLDYYGGFEYVDSEYVQVFGDYTFYFAEDDRVSDHIDRYYDDAEVMDDQT